MLFTIDPNYFPDNNLGPVFPVSNKSSMKKQKPCMATTLRRHGKGLEPEHPDTYQRKQLYLNPYPPGQLFVPSPAFYEQVGRVAVW